MLVIQSLNSPLPSLYVKLVDVFSRSVRMNHQVQTLSLVDVSLSVSCLHDNIQLAYLCEGLEHFLVVLTKEVKVLHATVVLEDALPDLIRVLSVVFVEDSLELWVL